MRRPRASLLHKQMYLRPLRRMFCHCCLERCHLTAAATRAASPQPAAPAPAHPPPRPRHSRRASAARRPPPSHSSGSRSTSHARGPPTRPCPSRRHAPAKPRRVKLSPQAPASTGGYAFQHRGVKRSEQVRSPPPSRESSQPTGTGDVGLVAHEGTLAAELPEEVPDEAVLQPPAQTPRRSRHRGGVVVRGHRLHGGGAPHSPPVV